MNDPKAIAKKKEFPRMLEQFKAEIARALPRHLSPDRMARIALTAFRRTPKLEECDPASIFASVIQASQLGLEPDMLGRSYLIPYYNNQKKRMECQFIPGWRGLVELMNRTGQATVWTGVLYEGQKYIYQQGDDPKLTVLEEGDEDNPDGFAYAYAIGRVKGTEYPVIERWSANRITKHRDRYNKVGKAHYSYSNWQMYARKVVLLQVLKYMPASAELSMAIALNDAAEMGKQHLTVEDAIEGTWTPEANDEPEQAPQPDINERLRRNAAKGQGTEEAPAQQSEADLYGTADDGPIPGLD